jgi:hypothetical protein
MSSFNSLYEEICYFNQSVPQFEDYFFRVELLKNKPIQYEKFTGIKLFNIILEYYLILNLILKISITIEWFYSYQH